MDSSIFPAFAAAYLALLVWGVVLATRHWWMTPANLPLLLKKHKWAWLLVGAVVMTIGSAVQLPIPSGAITNAFELFLVITIMMTKAFQDREAAGSR